MKRETSQIRQPALKPVYKNKGGVCSQAPLLCAYLKMPTPGETSTHLLKGATVRRKGISVLPGKPDPLHVIQSAGTEVYHGSTGAGKLRIGTV